MRVASKTTYHIPREIMRVCSSLRQQYRIGFRRSTAARAAGLTAARMVELHNGWPSSDEPRLFRVRSCTTVGWPMLRVFSKGETRCSVYVPLLYIYTQANGFRFVYSSAIMRPFSANCPYIFSYCKSTTIARSESTTYINSIGSLCRAHNGLNDL